MKDNLYIVKVYNGDGDSIIKLGYSNNIENRLRQYYYHNPLIEVIGTYYREDAVEFEKLIHNSIKSIYMNEWYSIDKLELITDLIKSKSNIKNIDIGVNKVYGKWDKNKLLNIIRESESDIAVSIQNLIYLIDNNNIVTGINNNSSKVKIGEKLNIDRKKVDYIILKLIELDLIRIYNDNYILNPLAYRIGDFIPNEYFDLFN